MQPHTTREFRLEYVEEQRKHWPPGSLLPRPPLTPLQIELINKGRCAKCGGRLSNEIVYAVYEAGAERGAELRCVSCGKRYFPFEKDEISDWRKTKDLRKVHLAVCRSVFRSFTCKRCNQQIEGYFTQWRKYCPECSILNNREKSRINNRMKNNLSRYLGK